MTSGELHHPLRVSQPGETANIGRVKLLMRLAALGVSMKSGEPCARYSGVGSGTSAARLDEVVAGEDAGLPDGVRWSYA